MGSDMQGIIIKSILVFILFFVNCGYSYAEETAKKEELSVSDIIKKARKSLKSKDYNKAVKLYEKALAKDNKNIKALKGLAKSNFKLKNFKQSAEIYGDILKIKPDYASGWYNMAYSYRKANLYNEAITAYNNYLMVKAEDPDVYLGLAKCYEALPDLENAVTNYKLYIEKEDRPKEEKWVLKAKEKVETLSKEIEVQKAKAAEIANTVAKPVEPEVKVEEKNDPEPEPVPEIELLELSPVKMMNNANQLIVEKKLKDAMILLSDIVFIQKENVESLFKQGLIYAQTGQLSRAIERWEALLKISPENKAAQANLKQAKDKIGNINMFHTDNTQNQMVVGDDYLKFFEKGNEHLLSGYFDKSIKFYYDALMIKPDFVPALVGMADAYLMMRLFDKAVREYEKAIIFNPDYTSSYLGLGYIYREKGNITKSKDYFSTFIQKALAKKEQKEDLIKQAIRALSTLKLTEK